MTRPDLPSYPARFAIVFTPILLALGGRYRGGWVQALTHDLLCIGVVMIAGFLLFETSLPEMQRRRFMVVLIGLGAGVAMIN